MIFERRAYTFQPGRIPEFWEAQQQWNLGETFAGVLSRNLSYFEVLAGAAEQIVHLYQFESPAEWERIYDEVYARHPSEYFAKARQLILEQDNIFLRAAPVAGLGLGDRGWLAPAIGDSNPNTILVTETTTSLLPGGLPSYWSGYSQFCEAEPALAVEKLIGTFFVLVGPLHTVTEYRWFSDLAELQALSRTREQSAAHRVFVDGFRPQVRARRTLLMRPAPFATHRRLFEQR
jgi:NIPSNAP